MRVLVIEDDGAIAEVMCEALAFAGHEARICNGVDALATAQDWRPNVITLDMWMEPLDGWAVAEQLQFDSTLSAVPLVCITALNQPERIAGEIRTRHFLPKPFDIRQFIGVVEDMVSPAGRQRQQTRTVRWLGSEQEALRGEENIS